MKTWEKAAANVGKVVAIVIGTPIVVSYAAILNLKDQIKK